MARVGNTGRTPWQDLFEIRARVQFPEKIQHALANPELLYREGDVSKLATLVRGALVALDEVNSAQLADLIQLSFDTMLIIGAGPGFAGYTEFFTTALQLIDAVEARGYPISRLLLSSARFQEELGVGNARRRRLIERAVTTSRGPAERLPALLTLAKFRIDVSKYRSARRALAECEQLLRSGTNPEFEPNFQTISGLAHYHTDPDTARKHFDESIRFGRDRTRELGIGQAVATAMHYLGRIAADHGEYRLAIQRYTEAKHLSDNYLAGYGFYHQRMAKILTAHGTTKEARYHLEQATEAFSKVQHVSTGLALLNGTWAQFHLRQGEPDKAEETLRKALLLGHIHNCPRIELVLLVQLVALRLRQRRLPSMIPLIIRAGWLYLRAEASGGFLGLPRQAKVAIRLVANVLRSSSLDEGKTNRVDTISCPCGADHTPSDRDP